MPATQEQSMSTTVKLQHLNSFPRVRKEWIKGDLTKDEKLAVLEGMDLGLTERWILSLIEEVREIRQTN